MPRKEGIFTIKRDGTFDRIIIDLNAAIAEEQDKAIPVFGDIFQRLS